MKIIKKAICGSLESSDILIIISPNENNGIEIDLNSIVLKTFGKAITKTIYEILDEYHVKDAEILINDKGATDFVIRARLKTALYRASDEKFDWSKEVGNV